MLGSVEVVRLPVHENTRSRQVTRCGLHAVYHVAMVTSRRVVARDHGAGVRGHGDCLVRMHR